jgi:predicted HD phosphohydrolase
VTIPAPVTLEELFTLYESRGYRKYGEGVNALEHALQCAALAFKDGATQELIAAALFHDVGWFLTIGGDSDDVVPVSGDHAALGARILSPLFGPEVAQPVALHVLAKRWRCTIDPDYFDELSEASQITFVAQGGTLNTDERSRFEVHPGFNAAMALRSWDDRAKTPGLDVPPLEEYRSLALHVATSWTMSRRFAAG